MGISEKDRSNIASRRGNKYINDCFYFMCDYVGANYGDYRLQKKEALSPMRCRLRRFLKGYWNRRHVGEVMKFLREYSARDINAITIEELDQKLRVLIDYTGGKGLLSEMLLHCIDLPSLSIVEDTDSLPLLPLHELQQNASTISLNNNPFQTISEMPVDLEKEVIASSSESSHLANRKMGRSSSLIMFSNPEATINAEEKPSPPAYVAGSQAALMS